MKFSYEAAILTGKIVSTVYVLKVLKEEYMERQAQLRYKDIIYLLLWE